MYRQLDEGRRIQIWALRKEGKSQTEIAQHLDIHRSTVSRELNRNSGPYGYEPKLAQSMASYRKKYHQDIIGKEYEELLIELNKQGFNFEKSQAFILHHHPELPVEDVDLLLKKSGLFI
ncbi:helix-turn-helix domain-containing protein [Vibrio comitans]|uniref:Transposase IS30-like HTH domain-containing protein n=1 Tax=Vibrio comitans NBRC 102076 TaxID=1219078 RepID=A0A4Y3IQ15_9VIBR|nr:helix-turn-helix domain-containing protein [Vibrio comitans]GEA61609.1 hypothetical protein VCO01S_28020 [Vibrio comitans NBRC 102076]